MRKRKVVPRQISIEAKLAAYHEAGHEIAANELDVATGGVVSIIHSEDGTAGRTFTETCGQSENAVICYAGHAAVVCLLGVGDMSDASACSNGARLDWEEAMVELGGDVARMEEAKAKAINIVLEHRSTIEALAIALTDGNGVVYMNDFWQSQMGWR
jgi:hypothetical protein